MARINRLPLPHAGSHTVALVSVQRLIPTTLARILETSAGV